MSDDYDNNNRGAGWPVAKALRVTAEIEHRKFYGALVRTGAQAERAPTHNLWLRAEDNKHEAYCVAIFRSTKEGAKLAGGEFALRSGEEFWVSLFKNKSENPKAPVMDISFQPKTPPDDDYGAKDPPDDDIPF